MEIATIADSIMEQWDIPESAMTDHLMECPKCQSEVIELVEICSSCDEDEDNEEEQIEFSEEDLKKLKEYCVAYKKGKESM